MEPTGNTGNPQDEIIVRGLLQVMDPALVSEQDIVTLNKLIGDRSATEIAQLKPAVLAEQMRRSVVAGHFSFTAPIGTIAMAVIKYLRGMLGEDDVRVAYDQMDLRELLQALIRNPREVLAISACLEPLVRRANHITGGEWVVPLSQHRDEGTGLNIDVAATVAYVQRFAFATALPQRFVETSNGQMRGITFLAALNNDPAISQAILDKINPILVQVADEPEQLTGIRQTINNGHVENDGHTYGGDYITFGGPGTVFNGPVTGKIVSGGASGDPSPTYRFRDEEI